MYWMTTIYVPQLQKTWCVLHLCAAGLSEAESDATFAHAANSACVMLNVGSPEGTPAAS